MTTIAIPTPRRRLRPARANTSADPRPTPEDGDATAPQDSQTHPSTNKGRRGRAAARSAEDSPQASPSGAIGAAVISAARRSAGLSRRRLARMLTVGPATVRAWENGSYPLFAVPHDQLCQLADALGQSGASVGHDLGELTLASQCDLLITGMLHGTEDYAEVPPVDDDADGAVARGLLRWALIGETPHLYRPYTTRGPLLAANDVANITAIAGALQAGTHGNDLVSFGTALIPLSKG